MGKHRPSGDGMVRKREAGRWKGRIVISHKENGDSIFHYIYANTRKELTAKLRQTITAYQGVDLTEESKMTLAAWLDRWLEQMASVLCPNTLERYRNSLDHHVKPCLGHKGLTQITPEDLRSLYETLKTRGRVHPRPGQSLGLSPTTVRGIHNTLHHALKSAVDQRLMPHKGKRHKPGTGCISQINDHLWEGRYSPIWPDGKKHARNVYAQTREECEGLLAELIQQMKAEITGEKERLKQNKKVS